MNKKLTGIALLAGALLMPAAVVPTLVYAADSTTDTAGEYVDDAAITAKVKAKFAKDKWVKGLDISVRTDKGVVDLTGTAGSSKESDRATTLASHIKGVKAVHNNLTVEAKK